MEATIVSTSQRDTRLYSVLARDLLNLCKPGILILLLISTGCPMIVAAGGTFPVDVFLPTILGGALLSASASTFNCIWDRDIDSIMNRTKLRPLPDGRIEIIEAFIFATVLLVLGIAVLWNYTNPVAALVALSGHLFYVLVYTVWLKRTTPQNIVIGGAAGAVPPIVGWAAVTGDIEISAMLLFALIFLWTPPHFWALALNRNEDYRRASIPMMPVICGEKSTHSQMLFYAITLLPVSWLFVYLTPQVGVISWIGLTSLASVFVFMNLKLYLLGKQVGGEDLRALKTKTSWKIFSFSMIYLALFFLVIVLDSIVKNS